MQNSDQAVVNYIFELGQLRRERRHGWFRLFQNPESVAEHVQRAAVLGYVLAQLEGGVDPHYVATLVLFHDNPETRTGDVDYIQRQYCKADEDAAAAAQTKELGPLGESFLKYWREVEGCQTAAGRIAKDAEVLEMAFSARELISQGCKQAIVWLENIEERLSVTSAKRLFELLIQSDPHAWWKQVKIQAQAKAGPTLIDR